MVQQKTNKKNILIINQSAELYGSDKALLELLENFPVNYNPIVVLHEKGPLTEKLNNLNIEIIETSVIKVKRGILNMKFLLSLPFEVYSSFITIRNQLSGRKISLIHSNATSVFIGAFYSFFFRIPHIWHVHEIIEEPKKIAKIYPSIVSFFSKKVIFNSKATENHFLTILPKIKKKGVLIYNGQKREFPYLGELEINKLRDKICSSCNKNTVVIALVGRISRLKGQKLLLKAFKELFEKFNNVHLLYVGSTPKGQEFYLENLNHKITTLNLTQKVTIFPFTENIWSIYDSIDIVVVPSTEPESFGLVATEAMLSKKPVIASNIGGLKEIVVDNETGFLFNHKNVVDLQRKIELLVQDNELRKKMGEKGHIRVKEHFSSEKYVKKIEKLYDSFI